jgi:hypothetical protein
MIKTTTIRTLDNEFVCGELMDKDTVLKEIGSLSADDQKIFNQLFRIGGTEWFNGYKVTVVIG